MLIQATKDATVVQRAEKINTAAGRCVRIVKNFLALARKRPPERSDVALNDVITEAIELLAYELRSGGIELTTALADDLPRFSADPHQLHQVLVNLLTNAHHAMRKVNGPKRISITSRADLVAGRVWVEMADTGPGIPSEIQQKVFEPFFTTKPPGQGTGLGLSLCRGIVEQHGGTLRLVSTPGRGTTFIIELPLTTVSRTVPPAAPRTILVVDDEEDIAGMIAEMLERDGHTAHIAANGQAALDLLAQRPYDLIVSDTKMPVLDGIGLYAEIERRFTSMRGRVIFVTGDVLDDDKQTFLASTGAPAITKPFHLNDVRSVVRQHLAQLESHRTNA
jgi:CheY-like chemotaxis protein